jgi:hypothetical protein
VFEDEDEVLCTRCEEPVHIDELDDDGVCTGCNEARGFRDEVTADYSFWTRP